MNEGVGAVLNADMLGQLIWADYAIIGVIVLSALLSLLRGFLREALSVLGWVVAIWLAFTYSDRLEALLINQISVPSLRQAAAFASIFIITLIVTALVNYLIGRLVENTGLSGTDRMLGMLFGAARGALIIGVLVLLAGLTALPRDRWWRQSVFVPHFERAALEVRDLLPPEIAGRIRY
ncbi:MAG: CvpA family protein [Gammaproteobacteria bacterium]